MNNIMEKCRTTRILGAIGIVTLILGTMMPYVKYNILGYKYSISLWGYWEGKIIMILAIANLLFIFKDLVEKYVPALFNSDLGKKIKDCNNPKFSLIPTVLSAIFAIYVTSILGIESFKYYNLGLFLMWIGTICLVAYALLHRPGNNNSTINM